MGVFFITFFKQSLFVHFCYLCTFLETKNNPAGFKDVISETKQRGSMR